MLIKEAQDRAAAAARNVKQEHIARCKRGDNTDILTFIEGYRGEESVVTLGLRPDRDDMLQAIAVIAPGFSLDVVAMTMETFHAATEKNPVTGEQWRPGEMAQAATEHDGIAKGWVTEALVTGVANRAGDQCQVIQPYVLGYLGRRVTVRWEEPLSSLDYPDMTMGGIVPDAVEEIMARPTLDQLMHTELPGFDATQLGLSPAAARAHQDIAGLRILKERMGDRMLTAMLPIDPTTERGQILMRRLREMENER